MATFNDYTTMLYSRRPVGFAGRKYNSSTDINAHETIKSTLNSAIVSYRIQCNRRCTRSA